MKNRISSTKKIIFFLYISAFVSLFSSCNENSFEQVVTFDVPKEAPKLVVTSEFLNGSDTLQVLISSSWNTSDEVLPQNKMDKCKVALYKGSQKIIDVPYSRSVEKVYYSNSVQSKIYLGYYNIKMDGLLQEKEGYTLKVSADGFESVEASCKMPETVKIKNVTFKKDGFKYITIDGFNSIYDLMTVSFDDPQDENFYNIECIQVIKGIADGKTYKNKMFFYTNQKFNASAFQDEEYYTSLNFSDETFNAKKMEFQMGIRASDVQYFSENGVWGSFNPDDYEILGYEIRLYSMSKERFAFDGSYGDYYNNIDNPFGEPIPLYTNFDKGFGLFTLLGTSTYFIKP